MIFRKELVTPEKAQEYWEQNAKNRKFRKTVAQDYANEILTGEWEPDTGETVTFDVNGKLINGQHRIYAIILANTPAELWIAEGASEKAFAKIDSGLKRTSGDVLYVAGAKSAVQIAGIIRKYLLLKSGRGFGATGGSQSRGLHAHDVLAEFKKRKRYWEACNEQTNEWYIEISRALAPSEIGGFYAYLSEVDGNDASRFFTKLCTGTDLKAKSPVRLLRNFLINSKHDVLHGRKIRALDRSAMIIKAWNLFRKNQHVDRLSWNPNKEEFPSAI